MPAFLLPTEPVDVARRLPRHRLRRARAGPGPGARAGGDHRGDRRLRACGAGAAAGSPPGASGRASPPRRARTLPRGQRRRGRAGHVQGPGPAAGQPVPAGRGLIIAAFAIGAERGLRLPQGRRFGREIERGDRGRRRRCRRRASAATARSRSSPGPTSTCSARRRRCSRSSRASRRCPACCRPTSTASSPPRRRRAGRARGSRAPGESPASNPTLVNNVETLSNVPHILARGADWFRSMGTGRLAGHHRRHGGRRRGRARRRRGRAGHAAARRDRRGRSAASRRRAGRSRRCSPAWPTPSSPPPQLDVARDLRGLRGHRQRAWASAGFIVYDDTACMVERRLRLLPVPLRRVVRPVPAVQARLRRRSPSTSQRIETGGGGRRRHRRASAHWLQRVTDGNRCYLAVEEQQMVVEHPAGVPRGVRRARRARSLPPAPHRSRCRSSSTWPTAPSPTTRRSGASARTGPTSPADRRRRARPRARSRRRPAPQRTVSPGRSVIAAPSTSTPASTPSASWSCSTPAGSGSWTSMRPGPADAQHARLGPAAGRAVGHVPQDADRTVGAAPVHGAGDELVPAHPVGVAVLGADHDVVAEPRRGLPAGRPRRDHVVHGPLALERAQVGERTSSGTTGGARTSDGSDWRSWPWAMVSAPRSGSGAASTPAAPATSSATLPT